MRKRYVGEEEKEEEIVDRQGLLYLARHMITKSRSCQLSDFCCDSLIESERISERCDRSY